MSNIAASAFEKADVFQLFDGGVNVTACWPESEGNKPIDEHKYKTLVLMIATSLGLTSEDAERLFPPYKMDDQRRDGAGAAQREPPLCAHLSREGVAQYWTHSSATPIPDVRCCDAREVSKGEAFPAAGHGPHVHCLYCFHAAIDSAVPAGRGVPPPVVEDFRDAASLQAHQQSHHDRYLTYLKLLEDCSSGNFEISGDMLSDEGKAACEDAAEQEGRHGCYMASMGTSACPIVVFYCAECDGFAPLVQLRSSGATQRRSERDGTNTENAEEENGVASAWTSTEELNVILSRLLLSCHLLYMMKGSQFAHRTDDGTWKPTDVDAHQRPRHVIYLFRPILFHDGVEEAVIEDFEDGAECTHAAVVLPQASVSGEPAELLLLSMGEDEGRETGGSVDASSTRYAPVVVGFAMEWASDELLQSKLNLVLRQHETGSGAVAPYLVTKRWVYVEDTEEWVWAHVLYHRIVTSLADLPLSYIDAADEGIRVVESYAIDAAMPERVPAQDNTKATSPFPSDIARAAVCNDEEGAGTSGEESEADPLAMDGCPYSMESRTIDFFARMTALAKAMHELAAWRLSVDENKEGLP